MGAVTVHWPSERKLHLPGAPLVLGAGLRGLPFLLGVSRAASDPAPHRPHRHRWVPGHDRNHMASPEPVPEKLSSLQFGVSP